jgi:hypothetical protein
MAFGTSHLFVTLIFAAAATFLPGIDGYVLHAHDDEMGMIAGASDGTSTTPLVPTPPSTTEYDVPASPSSPSNEPGVVLGPRGMRLDDAGVHEPTTGSNTQAQTTAQQQSEQDSGHSTADHAPLSTTAVTAETTFAEMGDEAVEEDNEDKAHKLVASYFKEPNHHTYQVSTPLVLV